MTIQIPNVGTGVPADQTGDSPWLAMKKVGENFSNQAHAASRLVGTAAGNVMGVGAFGLGGDAGSGFTINTNDLEVLKAALKGKGTRFFNNDSLTAANFNYAPSLYFDWVDRFAMLSIGGTLPALAKGVRITAGDHNSPAVTIVYELWTSQNATKDSNGFLKGASPIAEIYSDKMDLNQDATEQGGITFEKLGVGDYLVKGSLGFAQEGWYIETPKDANGNVLVAVVYEQLANNDLSIKTYAKKFDDETGDIVANLLKPRDIPNGRFISLRLHELPVEPPVPMGEPTTEV